MQEIFIFLTSFEIFFYKIFFNFKTCYFKFSLSFLQETFFRKQKKYWTKKPLLENNGLIMKHEVHEAVMAVLAAGGVLNPLAGGGR